MRLEQPLRKQGRNTRLLPLAMALAGAALCTGDAGAAETVSDTKASHELLDPNSRTDELGIFVRVPISHPGRRFPATMEFPTGQRWESGSPILRSPINTARRSTSTRTGRDEKRSLSFTVRPYGDPIALRSWSSCKNKLTNSSRRTSGFMRSVTIRRRPCRPSPKITR